MMLMPRQQNWRTSTLPFSLALQNTVNTGVSFDTSSGAIANSQRWAARGFQGYGPWIQYGRSAGMDGIGCNCQRGMGSLTFDGSGLFGTGLFGDTWGVPETVGVLIGLYALYSMFYTTKQTKTRLEASAQRRRVKKAARLRAKAKRLEEKGLGGIFA
jgi:hypothetical protein